MIKKILVATDGSQTARKAAEYAFSLAAMIKAEVVILSVIDGSPFIGKPFVPVSSGDLGFRESVEDFLQTDAERNVADAAELAKKHHISATTKVRQGHAVEKIVEEAEKSGVDLIVMGSHGKSALGAALMGSKSFGVLHRDTKIPVLLVRR